MAKPMVAGWKKLKRLARYLVGKPRLVYKYGWQGEEKEVTGYSDSDWAGCKDTGKSTSGGLIMIGGHFIKGWARTQKNIALSSGEAELIALVKVAAEMKGISAMAGDWGETLGGKAYVDSSASLGVAGRRARAN